jgi:hypothetical protein
VFPTTVPETTLGNPKLVLAMMKKKKGKEKRKKTAP